MGFSFSELIGGNATGNADRMDPSQTNPDNDPEIAASQAKLREFATLTPDQFTEPKVTRGWQGGGKEGDEGGQGLPSRTITYETPAGQVKVTEQWDPSKYGAYDSRMGGLINQEPPATPPTGAKLETTEKFWWTDKLAEPLQFNFDEKGTVQNALPKNSDTGSFGEQVVDFAGSLVGMAAMGLASYGAAYGLGAAATGTMAPAVGGVTEGAVAEGTLAASSAGASGAGTSAMSAGELSAMDAAGGAGAGTGEAGFVDLAVEGGMASSGGEGLIAAETVGAPTSTALGQEVASEGIVNSVASDASAAYSDAATAGYDGVAEVASQPVTEVTATQAPTATTQAAPVTQAATPVAESTGAYTTSTQAGANGTALNQPVTAGVQSGGTYWDKVVEFGSSKFGGQILSSAVSGIGGAISDYYKGQATSEDKQKERDWKVRNMNLENMPKINWTTRRVEAEKGFTATDPNVAAKMVKPVATTNRGIITKGQV